MPPQQDLLLREHVHSDPFAWLGPAVLLGTSYLIAYGASWLGIYVALRPWRRSQSDHWSERARAAWPGRRLGRLCFLVLWIAVLIAAHSGGSHLELLPRFATNFLFVAIVFVGVLAASIRWNRQINPAGALTPGGQRGAWLLNLSLGGTLILIGFVTYGAVPDVNNAQAWITIAVGTLISCAHLVWGWVFVLRKARIFRLASERLLSIARRAGQETGVAPRAVLELALPMVNALAFLPSRSIGVTDAALATLSDEELEAVCAHELAHLSEPRWVRAVRMSSSFVLASLVALPAATRPLYAAFGPGPMILAFESLFLIIVCWLVFHRRVSRKMEIRADTTARRFETVWGCYARAVEKIHEFNLVPAVISRRKHTHPELYDRLVAAGAEPEYPRPAPPPLAPFYAGLATVLAVATSGAVCLYLLARAIGS
jgi:Zn-dependent protease with chaperone function